MSQSAADYPLDALAELAKVQEILNDENTPLELLIENLQRATVLLQICQIKLQHSKAEVEKLLYSMEKQGEILQNSKKTDPEK